MTATTTDAQTLSDLAEANAWAKTHGAFWFAEVHHADDGSPYLTLITPSSLAAAGSPLVPVSWVIHRQPEGVVLQAPASLETVEPLPTLGDALAIVEFNERAYAATVGVTEAEQEAAAAWAARQGKGWSVEPFYSDDGLAALGVFAPHRWEDTQGEDEYVFQIARTVEGVALVETRQFTDLGVFATVVAALDGAAGIVRSA